MALHFVAASLRVSGGQTSSVAGVSRGSSKHSSSPNSASSGKSVASHERPENYFYKITIGDSVSFKKLEIITIVQIKN